MIHSENSALKANRPAAGNKKMFRRELRKNGTLFLMLLPGLIVLFFNCYLPMGGIVMAFERINFRRFAYFGDWVGMQNLEVFFKSTYSFIIARNTLAYNFAFIIFGTVIALFFAISLNELNGKFARKFYQTVMFLPYFMSWVVITYIVVGFLNTNYGLINTCRLSLFNIDPINFYATPKYWPYIIIALNVWKGAGYGSVMYLAGITNIDQSYYEAARIDGASKWQQIWRITLPLLKPMIIILTLLSIGKIFNTDIGLFYSVPQLGSNGGLVKAVCTIDTFVYTNLMSGNSVSAINLASAAAFLQSILGFALVMITNLIVRKINEDYALF